MKPLGLNEIRRMFQEFYESKGHFARGSFPLVPQQDKSLLIINSGMAPMKPYFAGQLEPPSRRMTTCQKCIRTADIENVGITSRHGTFFEMLGSFSFGDYFKKESLTWGWEFLTQVLAMPIEKLWVTVYEEDDEAYAIWKDEIGFPEERIVRLGKEDNFWEIGTGPCGPCSEIYYDRGEEAGCGRPDCKPGCECDRFVEFWNHVFTQFNNDGEGNYTELAQKNIDTGMGLERLACILQGVESIFDVDTIAQVRREVEKAVGVSYQDGDEQKDISLRIITDHIRSATFMIGDGILPGNEGRGYVLRRLIRRAVRCGRSLGAGKGFLAGLVEPVINTCGQAYPELEEKRIFIGRIVAAEEEQFDQTLDQGMERIAAYEKEMKKAGKDTLDGEQAFLLHDTYGFPIDITEEILKDDGFFVDREGFARAMDRQRERGRSDAAKKDFAWEGSYGEHLQDLHSTFTGYDHTADDGKILALFHKDEPVNSLKEGEEGDLILDQTPFYAESGGQVSDIGRIQSDRCSLQVMRVHRRQDVIIHRVKVQSGACHTGDLVHGEISLSRRNGAARNHTATHLLHGALRRILGDHVAQAGSSLDEQGLRFDFNHFEAMSNDQIRQVEDMVNEKIIEFLPVTTTEMTQEEARDSGAIGLFEDRYGDRVRVVSIGESSKELCGGTHVKNTGQIGSFHILSESGIASGVRRIEAVTGQAVLDALKEKEDLLKQSAEILKAKEKELPERLKKLVAEHKELNKSLEAIKQESLRSGAGEMLKDAREVAGIRLLTKSFSDMETKDMRNLCDELREGESNLALVFAVPGEGKVTFLVALTDDVVEQGHHAGKMIKELAAICGGNGGGKADFAQAGGKDPEKIPDAFAKAEELLG